MKAPITYLTYLRFDPAPGKITSPRDKKQPRTYFMHITPPLRKGQEYYYTTRKRAENFVAKVAGNWVKGGFAKVSGVVVKVDAVLPPLSAMSLAELKANHQIFEIPAAPQK
jgi:hypothetical protein